MKHMRWLVVFLSLVALVSTCDFANAGFVLVSEGKIQGGGVVKDEAPEGSKVYVEWTDKDGKVIWKTATQTVGKQGFVKFRAPTKDTKGNYVSDFKQWVRYPNAGEVSVLDVVAFEPFGTDFLVTPFPDFIRENLGLYLDLRIPDLYSDTNGDGNLGDGDVLYSATSGLAAILTLTRKKMFG
jgi:hypothetical protein